MSGFTVEKTPVIATNLIKVICNDCQGKCYYACVKFPDGSTGLAYECGSCGTAHPNTKGVSYPDIEYIT